MRLNKFLAQSGVASRRKSEQMIADGLIKVNGQKMSKSLGNSILAADLLEKYNPEQFEILGITDRGNEWGLKKKDYTIDDNPKFADLNRRGAILLDGSLVSTYARLLIRRVK